MKDLFQVIYYTKGGGKMELKEINNAKVGMFFRQHEFVLVDDGVRVCRLMAMEVVEGRKLDLTVVTSKGYSGKGYASLGLKMLIEWAVQNNYKEVTLTNIFGSAAIDRIAEKLGFRKESSRVWGKSLVGPLNL